MTIEERCAGTRLAKQVLELIREEYNQLPRDGRLAFAEFLRNRFFPTPVDESPQRQPFQNAKPQGDPIEEALSQCDTILGMIEDLPMEADDFGESVGEKVRGIRATIEKRQIVTEPQQIALNNMQSGVENWLHNDWD